MTISFNGTNGLTFADNSVQPTASYLPFRNRIINGDMRIDQRNAGASVTPTGSGYLVDRFFGTATQASKITFQQVADAPSGAKYSLKATIAAQFSPAATDAFWLLQRIEGYNVIDLKLGTASAVQITTSFQVKSSVTGTFSCYLWNSAVNRSYVATYAISSANTWTPLTITISGDQSGTWVTDNGIGLVLGFDLGSGSNYRTTSGSWQAGQYASTSGSTVFVNQTVGSTWQLAQVQLEAGSAATPFENRPYPVELQMCQRYYEKLDATANSIWVGAGYMYNASSGFAPWRFSVTKRITPTMSYGTASAFAMQTGGSTTSATAVNSVAAADPTSASVQCAISGTAGYAGGFLISSGAGNFLAASAEL